MFFILIKKVVQSVSQIQSYWICMNGAAAHLISEGEELIIMAFELTDRPLDPCAILVDERNRFVRYLTEMPRTVV